MTTTIAPDYCVHGTLNSWAGIVEGPADWWVTRNDLIVCVCEFRHDAERIAYCLRREEEREGTARRNDMGGAVSFGKNLSPDEVKRIEREWKQAAPWTKQFR